MANTYASADFAALAHTLKENLFEFEPASILEALHGDTLAAEKVMAIINLFTTDSFWCDWTVFNHTVCVFNNRSSDFFHISLPTMSEVVWAVSQARAIDPVGKFSNEVGGFIGVVAATEGFIHLPPQIQQEKTIEGLPLQFFLTKACSQREHSDESLDVEQEKFANIKNYVEVHSEALVTELKTVASTLV
jgi:hypothetical protein